MRKIPDAVTGRRLKPEDPGRASDTRVLVVKVALDEKTPLKLGHASRSSSTPDKRLPGARRSSRPQPACEN